MAEITPLVSLTHGSSTSWGKRTATRPQMSQIAYKERKQWKQVPAWRDSLKAELEKRSYSITSGPTRHQITSGLGERPAQHLFAVCSRENQSVSELASFCRSARSPVSSTSSRESGRSDQNDQRQMRTGRSEQSQSYAGYSQSEELRCSRDSRNPTPTRTQATTLPVREC